MNLIKQREFKGAEILGFIFEYTKNYHCQICGTSDIRTHYNREENYHVLYCAKCGLPMSHTYNLDDLEKEEES